MDSRAQPLYNWPSITGDRARLGRGMTMKSRSALRLIVFTLSVSLLGTTAFAQGAQAPAKQFEPTVGQAGKDVVWVPTPQALVDKMLDLAKLTPNDFHMDLGSG